MPQCFRNGCKGVEVLQQGGMLVCPVCHIKVSDSRPELLQSAGASAPQVEGPAKDAIQEMLENGARRPTLSF